jgi:hypothetical protein
MHWFVAALLMLVPVAQVKVAQVLVWASVMQLATVPAREELQAYSRVQISLEMELQAATEPLESVLLAQAASATDAQRTATTQRMEDPWKKMGSAAGR